MADETLVKVNSHRARRKMMALLGDRMPWAHFSWAREGEFYWVGAEDLAAVLAITGIGRARVPDDLMKCRRTDARITM